jgi:hypothetical protein
MLRYWSDAIDAVCWIWSGGGVEMGMETQVERRSGVATTATTAVNWQQQLNLTLFNSQLAEWQKYATGYTIQSWRRR